MGSRLAASDPKARKRTTAATATPTTSAIWAEGASVRAMAVPPSSTWSPSLSAAFAVSTRAWAWETGISSAGRSKVTVA